MTTLNITGDSAADQLLSEDAFALLVGMLLDQQVPMETAFAGPAKIRDRIGSIKPETTKPPADQVSDEVTVRNAVSSADIRRIEALPWANASTGSQGSISAIMQTETNGVICRSFTTTRESFRGVAIYKGETCRGFDGEWLMRSFVES